MVHQERLLPCLVTDLLEATLIANATKSIRKQPRENLGVQLRVVIYIDSGVAACPMPSILPLSRCLSAIALNSLAVLFSISALTNPCTTNGHSPESTPLSLSSFTGNDSLFSCKSLSDDNLKSTTTGGEFSEYPFRFSYEMSTSA